MKQVLDLYLDKFDMICLVKGLNLSVYSNGSKVVEFAKPYGFREVDYEWVWNVGLLNELTIEELHDLYYNCKKLMRKK